MTRVVRRVSYFILTPDSMDTLKCLMIQDSGLLYLLLYSRGTFIVWCLINPLPGSFPLWVWQPQIISMCFIQVLSDKILRKEKKGVMVFWVFKLNWVIYGLRKKRRRSRNSHMGALPRSLGLLWLCSTGSLTSPVSLMLLLIYSGCYNKFHRQGSL